MSTITSQELFEYLSQAQSLYYQLLLLVMPCRIGRHEMIYTVAETVGCEVLNVNLEISRQLLELSHRKRKLQLSEIFEDAVERVTVTDHSLGRLAFVDNIEILFDPSLEIHVLNLLQRASRGRILVSTWPGLIAEGSIVYAQSGHPEYKRYPIQDFFAFPSS